MLPQYESTRECKPFPRFDIGHQPVEPNHLCAIPFMGEARFIGDDFVNPPDEFRKHAVECMRMAASTRNAKEKAAWTGLAQRWTACAEVSEARYAIARQPRGAAAAPRGSSASARL